MSEEVDFASHVLMALLEIDHEINGCKARLSRGGETGDTRQTFAQNLPFARLHATVRWELVSQLIKQVFHFLPALPLGELVGYPELGGPRIGGRAGLLGQLDGRGGGGGRGRRVVWWGGGAGEGSGRRGGIAELAGRGAGARADVSGGADGRGDVFGDRHAPVRWEGHGRGYHGLGQRLGLERTGGILYIRVLVAIRMLCCRPRESRHATRCWRCW